MVDNHTPEFDARFLTALPVFNEVESVDAVLDLVAQHSPNILVVDDGSTDGTSEKLEARSDIRLVRHEVNQGYGAALKTAFQYARDNQFEFVVTIDCDGQHEPQRIRELFKGVLILGSTSFPELATCRSSILIRRRRSNVV